MAKRFLFMMTRPPQPSARTQESLDMILTVAAMEQAVSLLFLDDGVFQLLQQQWPDTIGCKNVAPIFQALPLYDVESFWVEKESVDQRGLQQSALLFPVKSVARMDLPQLIASHDLVLSC